MSRRILSSGRLAEFGLFAAVVIGLGATVRHNYLMFHSIAELFSIAVACAVFIIAWNARFFNESPFLSFIGISLASVAGLDLVHTMSFPGMPMLESASTNLSTQIWVSARLLQAGSFLAAALMANTQAKVNLVLAWQAMLFAAILLAIFAFGIFPTCFVEGVGLTPFKIYAEYAAMALTALTLVVLYRQRRTMGGGVFSAVFLGIFLMIPQEIAFTLYNDAYDALNTLGHLLKILSYFLLYKAIVVTAIRDPYNSVFLRLRRSEEALREHLSGLEDIVAQRTREAREGEERHRALLECASDWFWETDAQGRFIALSERSAETTGRPPAALLGLTHADL
ncbi:MAG TPA: MASE3 domain-containing protein, partial [Azospirillaceae bacterium]|nr:MASE3 domain-containing protein [Azospirillaceae bacterium]